MADLQAACEKSLELRHNLPRRPGKVMDLLEAIRGDLVVPGPDLLPTRDLGIVKEKLDALVAKIEKSYPEQDDPVEEGTDLHYAIIDLDATLHALRRHVVESDSYQDFLRHLKRIDCVLPTADYDFKDLFQHINKDKPTEKIYRRLKESIDEYASGKFEECLNKAEKLNEALIENLKQYTQTVFKCSVDSLGECRGVLLKATPDPEDSRSRLELFVVYLLEVSRFLRNLVAHDTKKPNLPLWMDERREWLRQQSASARLILLCELHAALELQHLWKNEVPAGVSEIQSGMSEVYPSSPALRSD